MNNMEVIMSKNQTKITYELREEEEIINSETGAITTTAKRKKQRIRHSKEPAFIKLYLDHLSKFKGTQISLNPILTEMLKHTTYADMDTNEGGMLLFLNKPLKEIIAKKCEVSLSRVDHAITDFVKKGYMVRPWNVSV